jgi:AmpE protein
MNFLTIIIALLVRQFLGTTDGIQSDDWMRRWQQRVSSWNLRPVGHLVMAVLPGLLLAQLLLDALYPMLFGLLWIVLAVILLLYALGRGDFHQLMEQYRGRCRAGDFEGAYLGTLSQLPWTGAEENPQSLQQVHVLVQRSFFYEGYQRWFPVLLYFVLLGPVGALAYRLLQLCRDEFELELADRVMLLADWAPSRLLAATFTLAGDFGGSRDELFRAVPDFTMAPTELLFKVGMAALGSSPLPAPDQPSFNESAARQNEDIGKLLSRSAVCWVVFLSLVVLLD